MQIECFKLRYPQISHIGEWVEVYRSSSLSLDGSFSISDLRKLADFAEQVANDFDKWYMKVIEIDAINGTEPPLSTDAVNIYWHDFSAGLTPEESLKKSGEYGRR